MNQYDVAGALQKYASKALRARDTDHLKELIKQLKAELKISKIEVHR